MKFFLTVVAVLLIGTIILSHQKLPSILPQEEVGCRDIITDPEDRVVLSDFCLSLADKIEEDGKLPEGERKISTPYELEDMRKGLADEKLFKLGKKYPTLPKCLGDYLNRIPVEDELSPECRAKWVASFRVIAKEVSK